MIFFFADNHYGTHPGKVLYDTLPDDLRADIHFFEDDWRALESGEWVDSCRLLILNLIGDTCGVPHPGPSAEKAVHRYLEHGGKVFLLHGSSAAFWKWDWWRKLPGMRWVRPGDPDNKPVSTHPVAPCTIRPSKVRHSLYGKLEEVALPEDEIYIDLEQVTPCMTLMETDVNGRTYPESMETVTPWGGKMVSLIPGHKPECVKLMSKNAETIIRYLLER